MLVTIDDQQNPISSSLSKKTCVVCGSQAVGVNFGAPTCAPCKGIDKNVK